MYEFSAELCYRSIAILRSLNQIQACKTIEEETIKAADSTVIDCMFIDELQHLKTLLWALNKLFQWEFRSMHPEEVRLLTATVQKYGIETNEQLKKCLDRIELALIKTNIEMLKQDSIREIERIKIRNKFVGENHYRKFLIYTPPTDRN